MGLMTMQGRLEMAENYFTQNLYEASYLMTKGFKLAGKEKSGGKMTVLFKRTKKLDEEAMNFYNGGEVEAKKYSDCYRSLKDFIFTK